MRRASRFSPYACVIAAVLCWVPGFGAAAQEPGEPVADPPGRVARLSLAEGDVALAPAGSEQWDAALVNRPLTTGDKVWVERGGRAELQIGAARVHLDQLTAFGFTELGDDVLRMSLTEGTAAVRLRRRAEHEVIEIYTPNATVALLRPGEYQVSVDEAGERTVVRTRSGESEVTNASASQRHRVRANQEGVFIGTASLVADIGALGARTAFERWANERERRAEHAESARYVSDDVIGYEDLDEHGTWVHAPQYGYVWRPRTHLASDWAPYRYGRWTWVAPWGWTWVDRAPWGFAPFHYGRWAYLHDGWCWVPGPKHLRPVYAPALVGWISGGQGGVSVSVAIGHGVGWFPLGPREVYIPGHRFSHRYFRDVNRSNTLMVDNTYITNVYLGRGRHIDYRHRHLPHAITTVERDHFARGRHVDRGRRFLDEWQLRRWRAEGRSPDRRPERSSLIFGTPHRSDGRALQGRDELPRAVGPKDGRADFFRPPPRPFGVHPGVEPSSRGGALRPRNPVQRPPTHIGPSPRAEPADRPRVDLREQFIRSRSGLDQGPAGLPRAARPGGASGAHPTPRPASPGAVRPATRPGSTGFGVPRSSSPTPARPPSVDRGQRSMGGAMGVPRSDTGAARQPLRGARPN